MNYYAALAFILIGIFLFYVRIGWLGLIFIVLGIITIAYDSLKKGTKNTWVELDKASGSSPEGKIKDYAENAIKITTAHIAQKNNEGYNAREFVSKAPKASKNFFSELKDLFK